MPKTVSQLPVILLTSAVYIGTAVTRNLAASANCVWGSTETLITMTKDKVIHVFN